MHPNVEGDRHHRTLTVVDSATLSSATPRETVERICHQDG